MSQRKAHLNRVIGACLAVALIAGIAAIADQAWAGKRTKIKFAALAPDGSTWMRVLREADKELREKTDKKLKFKIYAGGVMGDEADVIRKLKVGQVQSAGFTGIGLGKLAPMVRVLEQPMLFRSYEEVDLILEKLDHRFQKAFDDAGFKLLGWAEAGMVNLFTSKPVRGPQDLDGVKMWAWEGDPVAAAMYEAFNVVPVPLGVPDVLTSLQTGMLQGVYAPPLGAIALQWHTRVKYFSTEPLVYASGAVILKKNFFEKMDPEYQTLLTDVMKRYCRKLVLETRKENQASFETLKKEGLQPVTATPEQVEAFRKGAMKARTKLKGDLFPAELADEVDAILAAHRGGK